MNRIGILECAVVIVEQTIYSSSKIIPILFEDLKKYRNCVIIPITILVHNSLYNTAYIDITSFTNYDKYVFGLVLNSGILTLSMYF